MSGPAPQPRHMTPSPPTFLESLTAAERDALLSAGHVRRWSVGEVLFREGDTAGSAIVIVSGLVKIHKRGRDGDELILSLCGPGDLLGEVTAVQGATRSADAVALEDGRGRRGGRRRPARAARALSPPRAGAARAGAPASAARRPAPARVRRRREPAAGDEPPARAGRAVRRGWAGRDARRSTMPISQEELASWAAASRESTARALRTLRELGLIETHRKRMVVLDADGLRQHASRL